MTDSRVREPAERIRIGIAPMLRELLLLAAKEAEAGFVQRIFLKADEAADKVIAKIDDLIAAELAAALASEPEVSEAALVLKAAEDECWSIKCESYPTGGGDADVGWEVVSHWQAEPHERVEGRGPTPLKALLDAMAIRPAALSRQQPAAEAGNLTIGGTVCVSTTFKHRSDWLGWTGYISGICVDNETSRISYEVSDTWPPTEKHGRTDGFYAEDLTYAPPPSPQTPEG